MSGSLLAVIARRLLHLPVMRYVDDYFSVARAETTERDMLFFARCVLRVWDAIRLLFCD